MWPDPLPVFWKKDSYGKDTQANQIDVSAQQAR
jgi:hypothetical protein